MKVPSEAEETMWNFQTMGLTTGRHPLAMRRPELQAFGALTVHQACAMKPGSTVRLAGAVISRQRPPTAKGFTFMILEDETGYIPTALQPALYEQFSRVLREGTLLVEGRLEAAPEEVQNGTNIYRSIFIEKIWSIHAVTGQRQAVNIGAVGFPGENPRFATRAQAATG
ncbi:hypothetical protein EON80_15025 [bacterium]|nr:MAG: hypothetical protein EON80_15025 [bacterium]